MSTDPFLWDAPETAEFWPQDYDRIILGQTDSTMREAARRAPDITAPTWIFARRQTVALGRRGRAWAQPAGSFSATLLMRPAGSIAEAGLRSFLMSYALRETLAMLVSPDALTLKWPNDVLLNGGKVAGILLESNSAAGQTNWLSIGVGVNLIDAPASNEVEPGAVRPVSVSGEGGQVARAEDLLFWLAGSFANHERIFRDHGFGPMRRLWMRHAARIGETITARLPKESIEGVFENVDENGHLMLRTPQGVRAIAAADVYF